MKSIEERVSKTFMKNYYNTKLVNLMKGLEMIEEWVEEIDIVSALTPLSKIIAEAKRSKLIQLHLEVTQALGFVKKDIITCVLDGEL